jgi:hypothetical protein
MSKTYCLPGVIVGAKPKSNLELIAYMGSLRLKARNDKKKGF